MIMKNSKISTASKLPDISKISHSKVSIKEKDFKSLEAEIKKVQYPTHAISNAQDLNDKISHFKSTKVKKELSESLKFLNSYRQVRGDGNCFFRALAFSYISSLAEPSFTNCFAFLDDVSLTCCFQESIHRDFQKFYDHQFLVDVIKKDWEAAYLKCMKDSASIKLKALLKLFTDYPYLDFIIILYFRALCLKALWQFSDEFKGFLIGTEDRAIRTYGQQTEGVAIHLCSRMLQIKIFVYEVRKDEIHTYKYVNISHQITTIYLLYYENHYDIIQKNDNIKAEDSVLRGQSDYYSDVNEKMIEGTCIQCKDKTYVYQESGLCVKCYETSLNALKNISKENNFVKGKCGQCFKVKDEISVSLGLCRECLEYQSQLEKGLQEKKQHQTKFDKCLMCKFKDTVYVETGVCKICTRDSKKLTNTYFQKKHDEEERDKKKEGTVHKSAIKNEIRPDRRSQIKSEIPSSDKEQKPVSQRPSGMSQSTRASLIYGRCNCCRISTTISSETCLCRQCQNTQKRLMNQISPSKREKQKPEIARSNLVPSQTQRFTITRDCKRCHWRSLVNPDTLICEKCTKEMYRSDNLVYICKVCDKDYRLNKIEFNEKAKICSRCEAKQKSTYEDYCCKKCGRISVRGVGFSGGHCFDCRLKYKL